MTEFCEEAWGRNLTLFEKTRDMPFNTKLAEGTLSEAVFRHYMIQDAHYLEGFARGLSLVAAKGWHADHVVHFAEAAQVAIVVERSLHGEYFEKFGISAGDFDETERSPACEHYVTFLLATTALEPFEVGLAGLLPCFWIYREIGVAIHRRAASDNPYRAWIDTYAGDEFSQAVDRVVETVNSVAEETSPRTIAQMHKAYKRSAQLEWMFWDSAHRLGEWPV